MPGNIQTCFIFWIIISNMASKKNTRLRFIKEGIRNFRSVGSVSRSSPFVCRSMTRLVPRLKNGIILEFGAGDGVITEEILRQMSPDDRLLVFEIHPEFCDQLRKIKDTRMTVYEESAENASQILATLGLEQADLIISAIPFLLFPKQDALRLIGAFRNILRPGGRYIQLHYSLNLKEQYEEIFDEVQIRFVPINIPPAFIFECCKKS